MKRAFNRDEHIYRSNAFEEIIKDTIRFFNGTPVVELPPETRFEGTGVYAIYYIGQNFLYQSLVERNRIDFSVPIYVGKAVPRGWRQARIDNLTDKKSYELNGRLREHSRSIKQTETLEDDAFHCRFMILENAASNLIGTVEAALIRLYKPTWNTVVDGFGNHDPGKGRYSQARSEWDTIHPGRAWADKCTGVAPNPEVIREKIQQYFSDGEES